MAAKAIEQLLDELYNTPQNKVASATIRRFLTLVRTNRVRQSDAVARFGAQLLQSDYRSLPEDELWAVVEQVALAALDCGAVECAESIVEGATNKFPDSARAKRLVGMCHEAAGRTTEAVDLYNEVLKEKPCEPLVLKRLVAMKRAQGSLSGAAEQLRQYLQMYALDGEAWEELADLYLQAQLHQQAAFCYEELLLLSPGNLGVQVRYADALYTAGGAANLRTARTYYAAALQLSEGCNLRALYGVVAATSALSAIRVRASDDALVAPDLGKLAAAQLLQLYAQRHPSKVGLVRGMLKAMGLSP